VRFRISRGLYFAKTCLESTAACSACLKCSFVRSCVRRGVTIVSLYSCYIARLPRTFIYRADTRRMTKSHTVDPESRFNLSTTRACCTRILILGEASRCGACAHFTFPCDEHENHSLRSFFHFCPPLDGDPLLGMILRARYINNNTEKICTLFCGFFMQILSIYFTNERREVLLYL